MSGLRTGVVVLVLAAAGLLAAPAWAAPGLIGEWSLDEAGQRLADTSGSGVDGTLGATAGADANDPAPIAGVVGRALRFGGDDWVVLPDVAALEPARIAVEAWFRADSSPGQWRYIVSKGGSDCNASSYGLYSAVNGGLGFYVLGGGAADYAVSPLASPAVWDGRWHHAVGTFDGSTVRLFVDGDEVGNGTAWRAPIRYGIPSKGIYIGAYRGSCDLPFVGDIDQVRIWSEALTPVEIAAAAAAVTRPAGGSSGGGSGSGSNAGQERPDLQLSYTVDRSSVRAGDTVLHRLKVRLKNPSRSAGTSAAMATLALPQGTRLVSARSSRGPGCTGALLVTCPLDAISGTAVGEVEVAVKILTRRTFVTTATVSAGEGDLDPADNRASASVRVRGAAAQLRPPRIVARDKARASRQGANALVTATLRVDTAARVTVLLRRGAKARTVLALPGSRVGATRLGRRAASITTSLRGPTTLSVRLLVGRAELLRGLPRTMVVTASGAGGRRTQLRLALRG